jgi:hypothetical protein
MKSKKYLLASYLYVLFNTYLVLVPSNLTTNERILLALITITFCGIVTYKAYKTYKTKIAIR